MKIIDINRNKKPNMEAFGKWIMSRNRGVKPMTLEEFMEKSPLPKEERKGIKMSWAEYMKIIHKADFEKRKKNS